MASSATLTWADVQAEVLLKVLPALLKLTRQAPSNFTWWMPSSSRTISGGFSAGVVLLASLP